MSLVGRALKRSARPLGIGVGLLAAVGLAIWVGVSLPTRAGGHSPDKPAAGSDVAKLRRVDRDSYSVPAGMIRRVGIETTPVAAAVRTRTLFRR